MDTKEKKEKKRNEKRKGKFKQKIYPLLDCHQILYNYNGNKIIILIIFLR